VQDFCKAPWYFCRLTFNAVSKSRANTHHWDLAREQNRVNAVAPPDAD
jgi:hypothetical protein